MLETLDYTIRIGSTPTFLYFDLYIYIYNQSSTKLTATSCVVQSVEHWSRDPIGSISSWRSWSCIFRNWSRLGFKIYIFLTLKFSTPWRETWRRVNARTVRLRFLYRQHTNFFILWFIIFNVQVWSPSGLAVVVDRVEHQSSFSSHVDTVLPRTIPPLQNERDLVG